MTESRFIAAKTRLLCQLFHSLFCSHRLAGACGDWRYTDSDTHHEIFQILGITDSTLTLSINHIGLFILCGNKLHKWSGRYRLGYLAPPVTKYSTPNASQITNLGSFVHKVVPHKCASWEIIENPLAYHNSKSFTDWESYSPALEIMNWKKVILSLSMVTEQEFNTTMRTLGTVPSEVNSWASIWF